MKKSPALYQALIPVVLLIFLLGINVLFFDDTLAGPNQIALLLAGSLAAMISVKLGFTWDHINTKVVSTIGSAMPSMLILLLIGSLAGTWMISGVVPVMIYYGLDVVSPQWFLVTSVVFSAVVSLATGSSWSTVATIGVALLGIGKALGISDAYVAGAIISGSYFGDKMSPLSDTTNLASAMAGTSLFTHIRYMMYTTVPSILLTLIIFTFMGFSSDFTGQDIHVEDVKSAIEGTFTITPWLFMVPVALFIIIVKKIAPVPALFIGTILGGLAAIIFQTNVIVEIAGEESVSIKSFYVAVMQAMFGEVALHTPNPSVNELLQTSGMEGMLHTIWLILSAMVFGGIMEAGGLLKRISDEIIKFARSTGSLVVSTVGTCVFFNLTASDQYLAIVVPGRMFSKTYREQGLKPEVLSRTLEDSGTVVSVLIPWNTCGATQSKVLGVATVAYLPYCFFNLISPIMSVLVACLNFKIRRTSDE